MFEVCKLVTISQQIEFSLIETAFLTRMPDLIGTEWTNSLDYNLWLNGDRQIIDNLKQSIKAKLELIQGLNCAFCGMALRVTSSEQIEHIAPKGKNRFPEYMFHPNNLVLACAMCNGFEKKEKKVFCNTISNSGLTYETHLFNIVHPKFDNPIEHYDLGRNGNKITITSRTLKGQKSIAMLKLDEEPHTIERGKMLMKHIYQINPNFQDLFNQICNDNELN
jgi:uncharacterized protein (TIGR02646 family)